ncbi:MAG: SUMF1/EgtB/PvdO family nonheme iron enzyme [Deltaproteobacteria bacterium]|nr:SUMF1/EgtB/PvdO family nonheme iron enzyme [Deltaproteobacteria bacterium]
MAVAKQFMARLRTNIDEPRALDVLAALDEALEQLAPPVSTDEAAVAVRCLHRATTALAMSAMSLPDGDERGRAAWPLAVRAVRGALLPFLATAHLELLDEHQTRDAVVVLARSARRDVLLASDRLADSALDGATLRDLRGDSRRRPVVRIVWGREWSGRRPSDPETRAQLQRAQGAVRDAKALLGGRLYTSATPMENHAKALVVDGLRGIVTSENLLAYGGEKGRHETRELGMLFVSPTLARHLTGRFVLQWSAVLDPDKSEPLAWAVAGSEAWHALAPFDGELDFDWRRPSYLGAVVREEAARDDPGRQGVARRAALDALARRLKVEPFSWLREQAERLGLVHVAADGRWTPYDASGAQNPDTLVTAVEEAVTTALRRPVVTAVAETPARSTIDPLVARVLADMVRVPAGQFRMGDDRVRSEAPRHCVVLSMPFLLGRVPVTQSLWHEVLGALPHLREVERHPEAPVIHVGYADILRFLDVLNGRDGAGRFELPTEAQWEYACRAGSDAAYCFGNDPGRGDGPGELELYAWTKRNAAARLRPAGQLRPNAWGLHDMHGLVYETVRDGFRDYARGEVRDPVGPIGADRIVARGGCWGRFPVDRRGDAVNEHFRSASRQVHEKSHRVSFRIACRLEDAP